MRPGYGVVSGWSCELGYRLWAAQPAWSLHQHQSSLQLDPVDHDPQWDAQARPSPPAVVSHSVLGPLAAEACLSPPVKIQSSFVSCLLINMLISS